MGKKVKQFNPSRKYKVLDYETVFTRTIPRKFDPAKAYEVIDSLPAKEKLSVQPKKPVTTHDENEFLKFWYTNPAVVQWRLAYVNKWNEEPDMNSSFYDYRKAFQEGEVPRYTASDQEVPHWKGMSEKSNIELKSDDHPTKWRDDIEKNEEYQELGKKIITARKELTDFIGTNKDELGNLPYNLGTGKEVLRKARELKSLVRRYRAIENRTRTLSQITDESIKEIKNKSIILGGEKQLDIANKYSRDVLNYVERTEINDHIEKTYGDMHKKKDPEDWLDMSSFLYRDKNIDETIDEMKLLDPIKVFNELDRIKKLPEYQRANYKGQKTIMQKEGITWLSEQFPENEQKAKAAEKEFFSFAPYANFFNEDGTASVEGLKSWAEHQLEITDGLMNDLKAKEIYLYSPERMQALAGKPAEKFRKNQFEMVKKVEKEKRMLRNTKTLLNQVLLLPDRKDRFLSYIGSGRLFKDIGTGIAAEAYGKKGSATLDIATLGVREAARSLNVLSIVNRKNKGEEISKGEEILLTSFGMLEEITRQSDVPSGYVIGRGLVDMVPYMASFVYSGPTYAAIRAGLKKGLVKKTAGLAKKKAFKITGAGARIFGKTEINMIDMATTNLSRLVAVGGQTLMIPQMYAENIARHMTDDVRIAVSDKYDDIYAMIEENTADRPLPAVFKGTWEGYSEILTEHMGLKLMSAAKLPAKILKEMGGEKFANKLLLKKYLDIKGFKNLGNVRKRIVNKRLGWHGIREEYAEELANLYMTEIGTGERKKAGKPLWNWKEQFETFMTVALAGGVISSTQYTAKKIAGDNVLYTRKKADGTEQKVRLRMDTHDELLAEFNQEGFINGDKIDEIIQKHNLSKDQIDLVLNLSVEAGKQKVAEGVSGEPKMGPPSYELYGKKVTKKAAEVAIRGAETIEDLNVLKVTNDPELSAQLGAKFEAITTVGKIRAKKPGELTKEQKQKRLDEAVEREKLKAEPDIMFNALKRIGYDVEDATEEEVSSAYTGRVLATIQYQDKRISKEEYAKKMLISEDVPEDQKDDMLEEYQAIFVPRVVTKKTVEGLIAQRAKERKGKRPEKISRDEQHLANLKEMQSFGKDFGSAIDNIALKLKKLYEKADKIQRAEAKKRGLKILQLPKEEAEKIPELKEARKLEALVNFMNIVYGDELKQGSDIGEAIANQEKEMKLAALEKAKPEPAEVKTAYQGYTNLEKRDFNYFTIRPEEAKDYGPRVREVKINTEGFLDAFKDNKTYYSLRHEFKKNTGEDYDILDKSEQGLVTQAKFFNFLLEKGYKGLDYTGYSDTQYLVSFGPESIIETTRPDLPKPEDYFEGKGIPEKHTELIEDLKTKKKITGTGVFSTRGRFVMTDTEGREFGVMVNHDLDDKQRNTLFTALAEDKTFTTRLVLKKDWNPDDEFKDISGKPYGDKIEVLLGKLVIGNVQITDFAAGPAMAEEVIKEKAKEGTDLVFKQNPELANIGTLEQYSAYLETIFPNSKFRDIVYHGTKHKFTAFSEKELGKSTEAATAKLGFFFTNNINDAKQYAGVKKPEILSVILNIENPYKVEYSSNKEKQASLFNLIKERFGKNDGVISIDAWDFYKSSEIVVFKPEQIHITGSEIDIQGFKDFVEKPGEKFVRKTLTPEEEAEEAILKAREALLKAGNMLSQDPTDQQAILPEDKQRYALEALQHAVNAIVRSGARTVDEILEKVRKNIKTLNLPDDEKLRLEQYLDVNIPEIERYVSGLKLARKTGTKVTVTDMEFTGKHISAENPFATSTERMTAHRSTFRQIFEAVPGVGRIRAEEIVYEITRPEVYDEPGTKKEYEAFLQKTADMGPEHLSLAVTMARKMSFKDAVSFLNFYSSTYLIEVIAVNLKENEGTVTSLNINDALHGLRTNFFYHQNKFTYTTETGKLIDDYEAAIGMSMRTHLKKVYDIVGGFPYGKYTKMGLMEEAKRKRIIKRAPEGLASQLKETPAFRGVAGFLSNFSPYEKDEEFTYEGISYPSNEHFYHAQKFTDKSIQNEIAQHSFRGLKAFVRTKGKIREDWNTYKNKVMRIGLNYKFSLPRYKKLLLSTGSEEIIERNTWGDKYWGQADGQGQNVLGKMLTEIRNELSLERPELASKESARRQVYAEDLRFLTEITGIPEATWENYFSPLTKETTALVKKGEKYVEQVFSNYDEFLGTDTYYRDRKGDIQPRIHPTIVNTFHANYQENEKTTSTRRNFIEKFFTVGAKGRGHKGTDVFSNLKKLASTIQQPDQLNFAFERISGNRGVSLLMNSSLYRKAQEIQSFDIDNPIVKFYKEKVQGPMKLKLLDGIINLDTGENAEAGEMTIDDVWLAQLIIFQQQEDVYDQNLGQFGDKKKVIVAMVPKYEIDKEKYEEIKKWFPRFDNAVSNISYRIRSNFSYFRKGKADIEQAKKLAYDFVYNYALNSKALTEIFHGKLSQYETEKLGGMLTDLFKRGGSSISEGYNVNEKIFHAALPKGFAEEYDLVLGEYTHMISNDNIAKIFGADKELMDGAQFFLEGEFGIPLQEAMGDVYGKKKEFGPLDSVKAIYDVTNERLLRGLTKTLLINIDILADIKKDSVFDKLRNFMREFGIQTLSFESGTKKTEFGEEAVKLFDGENFVFPEKAHMYKRNLRNFYIQQDLRQPVIPTGTNQVTQFYTNILSLPNSPALTDLLNTAKKKSLDQLANEFSGIKGRERQRKWLMEKVDKLGQEHLKQLLNAGASLMEPTYRPMLEKILSSYVTRNGLQVMVNRLTTMAVPAGDVDLRPMRKTADGKVIFPEGAFNIEGLRYAKWVNSRKKAIKEVNAKPEYYWDMFDREGKIREQEIREDEKGWIIPGEFGISDRVPACDLHSHRLIRAKYRIRAGNFTMMDNESSDICKEDYDGDLRFNTVMFKREDEPLFGNTRKGIANEILLEVAHEYYNPENFEMINRPIETKKYDAVVKFLREFQREYIEYEAWDPDGFEEGYLKNTVGNVSKAIMVDISAIWSYIKALDLQFKKGESVIIPVIDLENPEKTKRNIILTGFAKDKYNLIKAHLSNITNLAFDNANEGGKIEILGWNEVTASMAAISLMSYQKIDNIPAGLTRDQEITWVDDQLTEFVGRLGIYFSSPEAREFVRLERRRRGVTEKGSITGTRKALLNKFPKLRHRVNSLIDLYFKGRDLQVLGSLRNLSIDAPQTPFELIRAEETYDKVALNKLKLIDTKKIGKGEDIHPLFKLSREVLEFSKKYIFNQNYEFSEAGEDIRSTIEYLILGAEKREFLTNNELKAILRGLNAIGVISAINNGRPFEMIERALYDQIDNLREAYPDNKFLNFVQRVPYTHKEQKRKFIQILDDYKFTPIPDDVLDNVRIDFDKLDEPEKRHFALYVYMKYGTTGSPYNGSYASLMGNEYRTFVSHMNELESDRFNHTKIPAEERENIIHWITQVSPVLNKQFGAKPVEFRGVYDINSTYKYEDAFEKKETKPGDVIRNLQGKLVPKNLTYSSLIGIPVEISDKIILPIIAKALDKGQEIAKAIDKGLTALRKTGWYKGYSPDKQEQIEKQIIEGNKILFEEIEMNVNNYDYAEVKKEKEAVEYLKSKGIKDLSKITAEDGYKLLKSGGPYIFDWLEKNGFTREQLEDATPEEMMHNYDQKIKRVPDLLVETDISEADARITRTAMHIPALEKDKYFKELSAVDKQFKTIDPGIRDRVYEKYLTDLKFVRQIYRELKNFSRFSNFLKDRNGMKEIRDEIATLDRIAKAPLEKYINETLSAEYFYDLVGRENEENYQGIKNATKYLAEAAEQEHPDFSLQDIPLSKTPQLDLLMLHRGRIGKETSLLQITVKQVSEAHEDISEEQFETRIRMRQFEDVLGEDIRALITTRKNNDFFIDPWEVNVKDFIKEGTKAEDLVTLNKVLSNELRRAGTELSSELPEEIDIPEHIEQYAKKVIAAIRFLRHIRTFASKYHPKHFYYKKRGKIASIMFPKIYMSQIEAIKRYGAAFGVYIHKYLMPSVYDNIVVGEQEDTKGRKHPVTYNLKKKGFFREFNKAKTISEKRASLKKLNGYRKMAIKAYRSSEDADHKYIRSQTKIIPAKGLSRKLLPELETTDKWGALDEMMMSLINRHYMADIAPFAEYVVTKYKGTDRASKYIEIEIDKQVYQLNPDRVNYDAKTWNFYNGYMRLVAAQVLALNVHAGMNNLLAGTTQDLIMEPGYVFNTIARIFSPVGKAVTGRFATKDEWLTIQKAVNIMKKHKIATVVDDTRYDKLGRTFGKLERGAYIITEYVERWNQGLLFVGMISKDQWEAYNLDGTLKDDMKDKAFTKMQISVWKNIIQEIHGRYGWDKAQYSYYAWGKALAFLRFPWMHSLFINTWGRRLTDYNNQIHEGFFWGSMRQVKLWKYNKFMSEEKRKQLAEKYKNQDATDPSIFMQMVIDSEGEKINWWDISRNDRVAIRRMVFALSAMLSTGIAYLLVKGKHDDLLKGKKEGEAKLRKYIAARQLSKLTAEERKEHYRLKFFEDMTSMVLEDTAIPFNPFFWIKTVGENPFPALNMIKSIAKLMTDLKNTIIGSEKAKYDKSGDLYQKGELKIINDLMAIPPVLSQMWKNFRLQYRRKTGKILEEQLDQELNNEFIKGTINIMLLECWRLDIPPEERAEWISDNFEQFHFMLFPAMAKTQTREITRLRNAFKDAIFKDIDIEKADIEHYLREKIEGMSRKERKEWTEDYKPDKEKVNTLIQELSKIE